MKQIPLGPTGPPPLRVQPDHLANRFKDAMLPQVLATPVMILIMENAALNAIKPFLDAGESAVGTAVDVKHFAATPVGHEVRATAEVVNVEGKRIDFKVSASDGIEEIGSGTHERIVIDLRSFNERLAKKVLQGQVRPRFRIRRRCASPRTMMWSTHSRRIDPISRSTKHSARVRPVQ